MQEKVSYLSPSQGGGVFFQATQVPCLRVEQGVRLLFLCGLVTGAGVAGTVVTAGVRGWDWLFWSLCAQGWQVGECGDLDWVLVMGRYEWV